MYGWYAPDPRMRANIGIRRRLAPLLDNSRAEIELINALLLSLPGSPCLYYGDEIGMGDNIWLDDRDARAHADAVDAGPQRRASPPPTPASSTCRSSSRSCTTTAINVEAQMATPSSLLHWMRGMLASARQHPVFGLGAYVAVEADNDAVLAFLRVLRPRRPGRARRDRALRQQPRPRAAGRDPRPARVPAGPRSRTSSAARLPRTCPPTAAPHDAGLPRLLLAARLGRRRPRG